MEVTPDMRKASLFKRFIRLVVKIFADAVKNSFF